MVHFEGHGSCGSLDGGHATGLRRPTPAVLSFPLEPGRAAPETPVRSFLPSLFERRRRIRSSLVCGHHGVLTFRRSTRNVDHLIVTLGVYSGISKSKFSRIRERVDTQQLSALPRRDVLNVQIRAHVVLTPSPSGSRSTVAAKSSGQLEVRGLSPGTSGDLMHMLV